MFTNTFLAQVRWCRSHLPVGLVTNNHLGEALSPYALLSGAFTGAVPFAAGTNLSPGSAGGPPARSLQSGWIGRAYIGVLPGTFSP